MTVSWERAAELHFTPAGASQATVTLAHAAQGWRSLTAAAARAQLYPIKM